MARFAKIFIADFSSNFPSLCFRAFRTLWSSFRAAMLETTLENLLGLILSARGLLTAL